jgi:hypothetical protein
MPKNWAEVNEVTAFDQVTFAQCFGNIYSVSADTSS